MTQWQSDLRASSWQIPLWELTRVLLPALAQDTRSIILNAHSYPTSCHTPALVFRTWAPSERPLGFGSCQGGDVAPAEAALRQGSEGASSSLGRAESPLHPWEVGLCWVYLDGGEAVELPL